MIKPPKSALKFLRWFCRADYLEEIEGDLTEVFKKQVKASPRKAKWKFTWSVMKYFRPEFIMTIERQPNSYGMLRSYLKIGWRNLVKNRGYSLINICGLSSGMAVSLLILLYVNHEFSYDRFHQNLPEIYRMGAKLNYGGQEVQMMSMSSQFGPLTMQNDATVENYVRTRNPGRILIKADGKDAQFESDLLFVDSSFFSVFSFQLISGNRGSLAEPSKVFLTESSVKRFFGDQDAIGKVILYQNEIPLQVVGVVQDVPSNSSIRFNMVASFPTLALIESEKIHYEHKLAGLGAYITYFQLKPGVAPLHVEETFKKIKSESIDENYNLEPFARSYLNGSMASTGSTYVYLFLTIGLVILGLALVNYLSLTTARATLRAKEVGIRKVIGAQRLSLAKQFFVESSQLTLIGFFMAIVLFRLLLPYFINVLGLEIQVDFVSNTQFLIIIVGLLLVSIAIAGFYPASVLSRFAPIEVIKGKLSSKGGGQWVRRGFTVFQFSTSIGLILFALVVHRQMDFVKHQKLGLQKEQVMAVNLDPSMAKNFQALKNELKNRTEFDKVSSASFPIFQNGTSAFFTKTPTTNEDVFINVIAVDEDFFTTLGIEWKEKPSRENLIGSCVVNETGVAKLKLSNSALDKKITLGVEEYEITGVSRDFNFESLRSKINGLVIYVDSDTTSAMAKSYGAVYLRLASLDNLPEQIKLVESIVKKHQGDKPFEYYFLDDAFDKLYKSEKRMAFIFDGFTAVAIFIACLGLLGLITLHAEMRTKEIGVRKILGAGIRSIILLLSRTYIILIVAGALLALPFSWWYADRWLSGFAYRTELPWWYAPIAVGLIFVFAIATTGYQSIKSAIKNPVDSLRMD